MLPLLFPFISDTVVAPPLDYQDIFVNEWGVVVFTPTGLSVTGAPGGSGELYFGREPFGPALVDAPVIWIHGAYFNEALFTVRSNQGELTVLYPEPDSVIAEGYVTAASWKISSPAPVPFSDMMDPPEIEEDMPFAWAVPIWRDVPSRQLYSPTTGRSLGNFLYYEAAMYLWSPPDGIYDPATLAGYYSPEGLAITIGEEPVVERVQLVPLPGGAEREPLDDEEICGVICDWAGGNLKSEEIEALWETWRPFFRKETSCDELTTDRRGQTERWLLFPLPWDEVERISSIELQIPDRYDLTVHYNRLFLGLVRVY